MPAATAVFNRISANNLRGDLFGGLTAAVIALPMALAFGVASGAGATAGLWGAVLVGLFAALFGGTPTLISEPTGPMTVVMTAVIAGLTAGISSVLALGYYGAAGSADGSGYELKVIAAAVIGGTSLTGGRGTALGALLGAVIIQIIDYGIIILGINPDYNQIIIGASLIIAVVFDQISTQFANRRALEAA